MTRQKRNSATGEKATEDRVRDATEFYHSVRDEKVISIRTVAKRHEVPWESFRDRIRRTASRKEAIENFQS
ncbi:hypothetical protein V8E54_012939 [Elaphomyces granulatus]